MKDIFEIKDIEKIYDILDSAEYGTLALSKGVVPYSVPLNFVRIDSCIYFHGSQFGKKMRFLDINKNVSFSVVKPYSIIASYFSSNSGLACPATHFFESVSIDGVAEVVKNSELKAKVLNALMQKLQPEGNYKNLTDKIYTNSISKTAIVKITPYKIRAKAKLGQHLPNERFTMIVNSLQKRGSKLDLQTIDKMREFREINN
jgi:nitroimidazol reductase NimA-like FMN-containing flavoprotein (pyridoxamine 5'-phosphate oxidase superfamily)